jgi:hypothetical protein
MSPTQLTLAQLRKDGYTARVVEQTIHAQGRVFKRDCFGFDVLALKVGANTDRSATDVVRLDPRGASVRRSGHTRRARQNSCAIKKRLSVGSGWRAACRVELVRPVAASSEPRPESAASASCTTCGGRKSRLADFVPNQEQTREALP